jgi:hypothetical protein
MPSLTDCIFVLKTSSLSFSVLATRGALKQQHHFAVQDCDWRFVGNLHLNPSLSPDTISFMIHFPDGANDSCAASGFTDGKVHDCMEMPAQPLTRPLQGNYILD